MNALDQAPLGRHRATVDAIAEIPREPQAARRIGRAEGRGPHVGLSSVHGEQLRDAQLLRLQVEEDVGPQEVTRP